VPPASRSLQAMDRSDAMHGAGRRMYSDLSVAKAGAEAVGGAQSADSLRTANEVSAPARARAQAWAGQKTELAKSPAAVQYKKTMQAQQSRYIRGRTFYQNGAQWIDANVASHPDAKKAQVKFNSDEYFALLKKHADAAQWLAVGRNVQLYLDGTVYEIVDGDGDASDKP